MAIRNIVQYGDAILTKKCRKVEKFDGRLSELINDMLETMKEADGAGLAAPQVGVLRRLVVIDIGEGPVEMVNPEIIEQSGEQRATEGCLSCPGKYGITIRPMYVKAKAQDRNGNWFEVDGEDLKARAICHELDHLEGILLFDSAVEMYDIEEPEEEYTGD